MRNVSDGRAVLIISDGLVCLYGCLTTMTDVWRRGAYSNGERRSYRSAAAQSCTTCICLFKSFRVGLRAFESLGTLVVVVVRASLLMS